MKNSLLALVCLFASLPVAATTPIPDGPLPVGPQPRPFPLPPLPPLPGPDFPILEPILPLDLPKLEGIGKTGLGCKEDESDCYVLKLKGVPLEVADGVSLRFTDLIDQRCYAHVVCKQAGKAYLAFEAKYADASTEEFILIESPGDERDDGRIFLLASKGIQIEMSEISLRKKNPGLYPPFQVKLSVTPVAE